jgi:hypothetical protein
MRLSVFFIVFMRKTNWNVPVLAWLVRPTTTTEDEASYVLQHLRQKHAPYRSVICSNILVDEFKII